MPSARATPSRRTRVVLCACAVATPLAIACGARSELDEESAIGGPDATADRAEITPDVAPRGDAASDAAKRDAGSDATDAGLDVATDAAPDADSGGFVEDAPPPLDAPTPDASDASDALAPADVAIAPACSVWGGLASPATYAMGSPYAIHPTPVAIGDFNHDGHPDIAAVASSIPNLSVYLNNGDGTFAPQATFADGASAEDLVTADFDGDGIADIAVIDGDPPCGAACCGGACTGYVAILRSLGDGTFAPAAYFETGGSIPQSGAARDMNGDGRPDVVVANLSGSIAVLLNDGAGGLRAPIVTSLGMELEHILALADLDANGAPDVVVSFESVYAASFQAFFNDGTGALTPGPAITFGSPLVSGYGYPSALALGDFSGHGRMDVVIADRPDEQLLLYANDGTGGFAAAPVLLPAGGAVGSIAGADFNADGILDLSVSGASSTTLKSWVELALGSGSGSYGSWITYIAPASESLVPADFNGDGFPDLAAGGEAWVSVFLAQCAADDGG